MASFDLLLSAKHDDDVEYIIRLANLKRMAGEFLTFGHAAAPLVSLGGDGGADSAVEGVTERDGSIAMWYASVASGVWLNAGEMAVAVALAAARSQDIDPVLRLAWYAPLAGAAEVALAEIDPAKGGHETPLGTLKADERGDVHLGSIKLRARQARVLTLRQLK
mmetsp:Transcript_21462/g.66552  ORF Transcript_21462/g.66552 Transcript_21462/m.66552 type:complete len:164 (-) Transcript_21462:148-639(-)